MVPVPPPAQVMVNGKDEFVLVFARTAVNGTYPISRITDYPHYEQANAVSCYDYRYPLVGGGLCQGSGLGFDYRGVSLEFTLDAKG